MALTGISVDVRLDKKAINNDLRGRTGAVGKVLAGFAGEVTKTIKVVFRERAGGEWWPVSSSIRQGSRGLTLNVNVRKTRPHKIIAQNASRLVFYWDREGRMFYGPGVNHPGSRPPVGLIVSGIERAGRRYRFTRTGPTIRYN